MQTTEVGLENQAVHHLPENSSAIYSEIERRKEHGADALLLLDRFMRIPQNMPRDRWPSTADLQAERIYGLRPVNRIGDLKKGKHNGHRYDFEMISCGHGVNRWRLHWPNRPGYPKTKNQSVLSLDPPISSFSAGKAPKPWGQVCAERDRNLSQPEAFSLVSQ